MQRNNSQSIIAVIPARYAATRFHAKLMQPLGDKPVIRHTYDATVATGLFDEVIVVTDSEVIFDEISKHGGRAIMSQKAHESGSDRIAEAIENMEVDVVINVQGDEPFIKKEPLEKLVRLFDDPSVRVGSLMRPLTDPADIQNPACVKVLVNQQNDALYFSRSIIPYPANKESLPSYFLHIGVYGYRKQTLLEFTTWPAAPPETWEKLEQLRYLYHGVPIRMAEVGFLSVAIDTPEDLERAQKMLGLQ
ncbi:MAG: 3-deoxy-manno-octulosonate cytidylyltransferase [Chitinophagaceae bacterium]